MHMTTYDVLPLAKKQNGAPRGFTTCKRHTASDNLQASNLCLTCEPKVPVPCIKVLGWIMFRLHMP